MTSWVLDDLTDSTAITFDRLPLQKQFYRISRHYATTCWYYRLLVSGCPIEEVSTPTRSLPSSHISSNAVHGRGLTPLRIRAPVVPLPKTIDANLHRVAAGRAPGCGAVGASVGL